jgi:dCTP deaminase
LLNDREIRKAVAAEQIGIRPFSTDLLQPVSYDLTLSVNILVPRDDVHAIDTSPPDDYNPDSKYYGRVPAWHQHTRGRAIPGGYDLRPQEFILGSTREEISLPPHYAARVEGKSSLGRLGIQVHITAGFIDPGFEGQVTLEIYNVAPWSVRLNEGMPIAQIVFEPVNPPEKDYSKTGRYQGQIGPTQSRYRFG